MLAASLLSLAAAASLSVASPLNRRQPTIRQAPGFSLVARVTGTPGPAFDTPVDHWRVIGGRIGAGLAAAVLNAEAGATFFVNGTAAEVAERRASVALPPMAVTGAGAVPGGLQADGPFEGSSQVVLGLNNGFGTEGVGIGDDAKLFLPPAYGSGSFVVCRQQNPPPVYTRPDYYVRFEQSEVPAHCVAIDLFAQCAELPPLEGVEELNIVNADATCYAH